MSVRKPKLVKKTTISYAAVEIWHVPGKVGEESCRGTCERTNDGNFRIEIDPDLDPPEYLDTLIHELLHAISDVWELELSERKVRLTATTLTQALRGIAPKANWIRPRRSR